MSPAPGGKRGVRALLICLAALALIGGALGVYTASYSRAGGDAQEAMAHAAPTEGMYAYGDPSAETGLILYPGGKVEYTAYAPLAQQIAQTAGLLCVVAKMPMQLAVLDPNAADAVMAAYPQVQAWLVGGHSLGGAMAASYAASHGDGVKGVVLLAAYSTQPLSVPVLSVYGGSDTVLDPGKYAEYRSNLPAGFTELVIPGGNHAQFGSYGEQKGDSAATIPPQRQWSITAQAIRDWLDGLDG